jgi:hypothetical protein
VSSIKLKGSTSGDVTLTVPAVAGTNTVTIPAVTSSVNVVGPAFSAHGPVQSIGNASWTKLTFDTEEFDTDGKFASDKFTPTVAGYYQISGGLYFGATSGACVINIYKNGVGHKRGAQGTGVSGFGMATGVSALIYLDADDYVELYVYQNSGGSTNTGSGGELKFFQGTYIRS